MQTLFQDPSNWSTLGDYDVAVIGAGPGGIGAAVASARNGAQTILVEKAGYPGGMATQSNCFHVMGFGVEGRQVVGGIADELVRRMNKTGDAYLQTRESPDYLSMDDRSLSSDVIVTDHGMRVHANRMMQTAGVHLQYYTSAIGAVTEGDRIVAVALDCVEGPRLLRAKQFVDATGDAHLVYRAGGECIEAPPEQTMTKTLLFDVGGVREFNRAESRARYLELFEKGLAPFEAQDRFMAIKCIEPEMVHLNFTLTAGNGLESDELTDLDRGRVVSQEYAPIQRLLPGSIRPRRRLAGRPMRSRSGDGVGGGGRRGRSGARARRRQQTALRWPQSQELRSTVAPESSRHAAGSLADAAFQELLQPRFSRALHFRRSTGP
jgi:ribulose 1,5-bisphosphate synthetase/thiazole synthase